MPAKLISLTKYDVIKVHCEWDECENTYGDVTQLMSHIDTAHLNEYIQCPKGQEEEVECKWRECDRAPFTDMFEMARHVYFHAFHSKLKGTGSVLLEKNRLDPCQLDTTSRNLIPDLPEMLHCRWEGCPEVFNNPQWFYDHVKDHCECYGTRKGDLRCLWRGCTELRKNKYKLKEHLKCHSQEKGLACPQCGSLFSFSSKLYDHIQRQQDPATSTYQCSHCNKRFATERILRDHMRHHVNHVMCPYCNMTVPTPSTLRTHIMYRHSDERPFQCEQCPYSAKTQKDLKSHLERHQQAYMECGMKSCGFRTLNSSELSSHYQRKHVADGKLSPYMCHLCDKSYHRGSKLTHHLKKAHDYQWPPGHRKFKYMLCEDNCYRLQTVRYESVELAQKKHVNLAVSQQSQTSQQPQTAQTTDEDYSYNLDLLGDVALQANRETASKQSSAIPTAQFTTDQAIDLTQPIFATIEPNQPSEAITEPTSMPQTQPTTTAASQPDITQKATSITRPQSTITPKQPTTTRKQPTVTQKKTTGTRQRKPQKEKLSGQLLIDEQPSTSAAAFEKSGNSETQDSLNNTSFDLEDQAAALEKALTGLSPVKKKPSKKQAAKRKTTTNRGNTAKKAKKSEEDVTTYPLTLANGQQLVVESNVPFAGVANEIPGSSVIGTITETLYEDIEITLGSPSSVMSSTPKKRTSNECTVSHSKVLNQPVLHIVSPKRGQGNGNHSQEATLGSKTPDRIERQRTLEELGLTTY